MRWVGNAACMGEMRCASTILVGTPGLKTLFGKYTCTREYNIKMYLNRNRAGVWTGLIRFRKGSSGSSGLV
jgi:hypothetical protein